MRSWRRLFDENAVVLGVAAVVAALVVGARLLMLNTELGGPGDQLVYYAQAGRLLPFTNQWYGPSYFVALRIVHQLSHLEWFMSGKVLSFVSICVYLVLCERLFRRVLSNTAHWLALAVIALNAQVISMAYSSLTIAYGAAWMLAAVTVLASATLDRNREWFLAGLLFGIAALARFQSIGLLLGGVAGTFVLEGPIRARGRGALLLVFGAAIPVVAWKSFLLAVQGYVPVDANFANLAAAAGEGVAFPEVGQLVQKYGSMLHYIADDPMRLMRILRTAAAQTIRFPIDEGVTLFGLVVCWLIPGTLLLGLRRSSYAPWTGAIVSGFLLTAIASNGWVYYYLPVLPGLVFIIAKAIEEPGRERSPMLVRLSWVVAVVATIGWSAAQVPKRFRDINWTEWTEARRYLNARAADAPMVVSTTAASLSYGAKFRYIDFDEIMVGHDSANFVDKLRARGVTHFVVSERHSLWVYPSERPLLADSIASLPAGLIRDTLIVSPKRVAIFSVVPR